MLGGHEQSAAPVSAPQPVARSAAMPAQKRAMMLGYLTYSIDARVKRQVKTLAAAGYAVDVICLADDIGQARDANLIGIKVPHYRGLSRWRYVRAYATFFIKAAWTAACLAIRHRYDVAIVCSMPDFIVACALGPKLRGATIVLDVHDPMPELYRVKFGRPAGCLGERLLMLEERVSAWMADRVLATHDLHLSRLVQAGIPRSKLRVVLNAPNPELFPYSDRPLRRGGGLRLVYQGTMSARLGIDVAIRAMRLLRARIPGIELLLIGNGEALEDYKRLAGALEVADIVRFEPPIPVERIAPVLHSCSIGVVPNRDNAATRLMLPVKLMEYAMLGVPIAAARLAPILQYFDARAVEFFEPENPADLAAAIVRLYENPDRLAQMAAAANRVALRLSCGWSENYLEAIAS